MFEEGCFQRFNKQKTETHARQASSLFSQSLLAFLYIIDDVLWKKVKMQLNCWNQAIQLVKLSEFNWTTSFHLIYRLNNSRKFYCFNEECWAFLCCLASWVLHEKKWTWCQERHSNASNASLIIFWQIKWPSQCMDHLIVGMKASKESASLYQNLDFPKCSYVKNCRLRGNALFFLHPTHHPGFLLCGAYRLSFMPKNQWHKFLRKEFLLKRMIITFWDYWGSTSSWTSGPKKKIVTSA